MSGKTHPATVIYIVNIGSVSFFSNSTVCVKGNMIVFEIKIIICREKSYLNILLNNF